MAYALQQTAFVRFEDYLAGERDVDFRSEYANGEIYAMAGASETHNTVATSFTVTLESTLKQECRIWQSDMKVVGKDYDNKPFAYYPDIMVACGENTDNPYYRTNPILIVEVLSGSTRRTDLGEKYHNYTCIRSLLEYVVVSQDVPLVRLFRRRTAWELETYHAGETFTLVSIDLTVPVELIYRRVRKEVGLEIP